MDDRASWESVWCAVAEGVVPLPSACRSAIASLSSALHAFSLLRLAIWNDCAHSVMELLRTIPRRLLVTSRWNPARNLADVYVPDVYVLGGRDMVLLSCAACSGSLETASALLQAGAQVDATGTFSQRTPLMCAASHGHARLVQRLLEADADAGQGDREGWKPLHFASFDGHGDVVALLLAHKADVNATDLWTCTPVGEAATSGHVGVVSQLLEAKADVAVRDRKGSTPMAHACCKGHFAVVELLLEAKACLHEADNKGRTPVSYAAQEGNVQVVQLLIGAKADVNEADLQGRTPISFAITHGHESVVSLLKSQG
jgi:ankyrin repeat protein